MTESIHYRGHVRIQNRSKLFNEVCALMLAKATHLVANASGRVEKIKRDARSRALGCALVRVSHESRGGFGFDASHIVATKLVRGRKTERSEKKSNR
jgi:hypothetical protein